MSASKEKWQSGLPEEVAFWEDWLSGRTPYKEDRALRLSSGRAFPWWAKPLIPGNPQRIRVLDVGAGPVTALGNRWDDKIVRIVPVDPLAKAYARVLERYGITPPIPTIEGVGEELVAQFGTNHFDFAYACNCLDHAVDPVACYQEMLEVLKPGCSLVTFHEMNEAVHQNYAGLHQWNFTVENNRVIVWNPDSRRDLFECCPVAVNPVIEAERKYLKLTLTKQAAT